MAKGNMLQGMARGKVGDVVFSRLNGQQISRVRNRQPYNPRTNKQLIQRAIMATVMQAYSAGKEIFNHSFQGKAVGSENQREFMKVNAKYLREIIANDLNNSLALADQLGRVVAPGATAPCDSPLIISQGSYAQNFFSWDNEESAFMIPVPQTNETCKAYCERNGLIPGDIYTLVSFGYSRASNPETLEDALKNQVPCTFYFVRLQVKDNALEDTTELNGVLGNAVATNGVPFLITDAKVKTALTALNYRETGHVPPGDWHIDTLGSYGMIRSRLDSALRSTSEIHTIHGDGLKNFENGIASGFIIDVWAAGATPVGDSDLILEGGDI